MTHGREFDKQCVYHIRVKGILDEKWSDWFYGFTITPQADDETLLAGPVADQAALHGLLARIRDLGLPLLSVKRVETGPRETRSEDRNASGKVTAAMLVVNAILWAVAMLASAIMHDRLFPLLAWGNFAGCLALVIYLYLARRRRDAS